MRTHLVLTQYFETYTKSIKKTKSISSYNNALRVLRKLKAIELQTNSILMIPLQRGNSVSEIKKHELFWKKTEKQFKDYCRNQQYLDSYISLLFKIFKAFLNWLQKHKHFKIIGFGSLFKISVKTIPIITLDEAKWQQLLLNDSHLHLKSTLSKTKDLFLFGCITGLRYSDLMLLKKNNLEIQSNTQIYLTVISKKTHTSTRLKLPSMAISLIQKYKSKSQQLLPYPSLNQFNKNLKQLGEQLGWTYEIGKFRNKREKPADIRTANGNRYRFCDLMSSHIMRKTSITNMLFNGMPEHMVRKISGHSENSKEFYRYVNYQQNYLDDQTDKIFKKLLIEKQS